MPLTAKGEKILGAMQKQYGAKKGKSVFYASINKGNVTGAEKGGGKLNKIDGDKAEAQRARKSATKAKVTATKSGERGSMSKRGGNAGETYGGKISHAQAQAKLAKAGNLVKEVGAHEGEMASGYGGKLMGMAAMNEMAGDKAAISGKKAERAGSKRMAGTPGLLPAAASYSGRAPAASGLGSHPMAHAKSTSQGRW